MGSRSESRSGSLGEEIAAPGTSAPPAGPAPPSGSADPDREFVERALHGDASAFEELVRRHQDAVYTRIRFMVQDREFAADLAQEVFLNAYRHLASFRGEALFKTWLGRISVNVTLHALERKRARKRRAKEISIHDTSGAGSAGGYSARGTAIDIPDRRNDPTEPLEREERRAAILRAVAALDEEYRVALALRELEGLSYQEIAEALEIPIGTVKSKIFRARQELQSKLKAKLKDLL